MKSVVPTTRIPDCDVDSMFVDRWSPRAFDSTPLIDEQVNALFEAARWAPSCFNEQPWQFFYTRSEEGRARFLTALISKNKLWARTAPLIGFICARRAFSRGKKENRHAPFDTGAAWMSLALQARTLGLYAHAMAGFSPDTAYAVLGISKEIYHIMAAFVVGYRADVSTLPEDLREAETPNTRNPHADSVTELFGE
jgi:nitroreductase